MALKIVKNLNRTILDDVNTTQLHTGNIVVQLGFNHKNCYTNKPFYTVEIMTIFSIFYERSSLFSKEKIHLYSYDGISPDEHNIQSHIEKIQSSIVRKATLNVKTLNLQIKFKNNYVLNIEDIKSPNHEFTFGQSIVLGPMTAYGTDFIVKNNRLDLSGWRA